jgi:hypothetical protein
VAEKSKKLIPNLKPLRRHEPFEEIEYSIGGDGGFIPQEASGGDEPTGKRPGTGRGKRGG